MSSSKDITFKQQGYTECKGKGKKKCGLDKLFKVNCSSDIFPTFFFPTI